jgi:hypothetical protein
MLGTSVRLPTNPGGSTPQYNNNSKKHYGANNLTNAPLSAPQVYTIQFDTILAEISHSQTLDPKNFEVQ